MIPAGVQIFIAVEAIDMRCGFPRLSGIAREKLGYEPRCGALFVFFGKRRHAIKVLFFDGTGFCLFYKRLDRGRFRIPQASDPNASSLELDENALDALLDGIDVEQPRTKRRVIN